MAAPLGIRMLGQLATKIKIAGSLRTLCTTHRLLVAPNDAENKQTHFGFETVSEEEKEDKGNAVYWYYHPSLIYLHSR